MSFLTIKGLTARLRGSSYPILRGVSLNVAPGEVHGLVGESGAGKSIIGKAVLGILPEAIEITGGSIELDGVNLLALPPAERRRRIGAMAALIPQDPLTALNPSRRIGPQITGRLVDILGWPRAKAEARARELLAEVHIPDPDRVMRSYPHELSGGMRQRVLIASAFAAEPKFIVADEPTTALDVTIQDQILMLLAELKQERQMSMILVSHDVGVIAQQCDLIAVMYAGKILECGRAVDVIESPRHPYTRGLLAAVPTLDAPGQRHPLQSIPGQPPSLADLPPGCPFQARCAFVRPECAAIPVTLDRVMPEHGSACPFVGGGDA